MRITYLLVLTVLLYSCASPPPVEAPAPQAVAPRIETPPQAPAIAAQLPETGEPAMHAIHNQRLQEVMQKMNALVYDQMRSQVEIKAQARQQAQELTGSARELSGTVQAILATMPTLNLEKSEQATFTALAEKLRGYGQEMEGQAEQNQMQGIPATMQAITSTCTACHALFRKSRSIMEKCKDPNYTC